MRGAVAKSISVTRCQLWDGQGSGNFFSLMLGGEGGGWSCGFDGFFLSMCLFVTCMRLHFWCRSDRLYLKKIYWSSWIDLILDYVRFKSISYFSDYKIIFIEKSILSFIKVLRFGVIIVYEMQDWGICGFYNGFWNDWFIYEYNLIQLTYNYILSELLCINFLSNRKFNYVQYHKISVIILY